VPIKINDPPLPPGRGEIDTSMAAGYNPWAAPPFDAYRNDILTRSTPPVTISDLRTSSTTQSVYRLRWNTIVPWNDFGARVIYYWNAVPQVDKQVNVMTEAEYGARFRDVGNSTAGNEGDIKALINEFIQPVHSSAANGRDGAPRPSDRHSMLQHWERVETNTQAGIPDFVMITEYGNPPRRVTAMVEVKNPWQVTPALIDQVIQSIACCILSNLLDQVPVAGLYPARLALEQLYGYMVRNAKVYGILTTLKGWCFVRRENEGRLYVTRMFGDFGAAQGISAGAAGEGYYPTQGFSIMQALYYLSSIAEATPDLPETPIGGRVGQVYLPQAGNSTNAAPRIRQPPPGPGQLGLGLGGLAPAYGGQGQFGHQGVQILGDYNQSECFQYDSAIEYKSFQFEPWLPENNLGPKTWIATTLPEHKKVVFKLWDAWRFDEEARNQEASVYLHLRSLWGKCVPSLLVKSPLEFFHALILQYIRV
jgi:hypothetical protein